MSETLLLDTDVVSDLFKRRPRAERYRPIVEEKRLALSFMTIAELYKWTIARKWNTAKVSELEATLQGYVIVPYDNELAWAWARVAAACGGDGRTIASSDAWIAATAIRHDLPFVTNNVKDFEAAEELCGLRLHRSQA